MRRPTNGEVTKIVEGKNYKILSRYKGSLKPILIQCSNNHEPFTIRLYYFLKNLRNGKVPCPTCRVPNPHNKNKRVKDILNDISDIDVLKEYYIKNDIQAWSPPRMKMCW